MTFNVLLLLASLIGMVHPFSPTIPFPTSLSSAEMNSRQRTCWEIHASNPPVSVVSVCTAELCCCQEEGGSALEILDNLNSRGLPYPIEEAPCLGACGGGAMVAIDFEDGSAALVSGIEETLSELGLSLSSSSDSKTIQEEKEGIQIETKTVINQDSVEPDLIGLNMVDAKLVAVVAENDVRCQENESVPSQVVPTLEPPESVKTKVSSESSNNSPTNSSPKQYTMSSDDVRERMRAEAASDTERINPWMNMASYLAGKARDKVLGTEE